MNAQRILPRVMDGLTHDEGTKRCIVMTSTAIHTIGLAEGHFACMVLNQPGSPAGAIIVLTREEVEAQITLLRNAIEDAERLDQGKAPIHAAHSLTRQ